MKKIPITDFQEGNCCPKCKSTKVSLYIQYPIIMEFDMHGKEIIRQHGVRVSKPSNKLLATLYNFVKERNEMQCASYKCQKCGWISETYIP